MAHTMGVVDQAVDQPQSSNSNHRTVGIMGACEWGKRPVDMGVGTVTPGHQTPT